ncbi:MAG: ABC transporter permease, partial [Candidatus Aminicenantes bacterium]
MRDKKPRLPRIPYWLLKQMYAFDIEEGYAGDIEEEFNEILLRKGRKKAVSWIWIHAIMAIPKTMQLYLVWGKDMFKNYIKIALRNIKRHKGFSFINISGLVVGMAVCLLLFQYVTFEQSYDDFHENAENIYRLNLTNFAGSHGAAGRTVKEAFPEVLEYVKLNKSFSMGIYAYEERKFQEKKVFFATESFLKVFSFNVLKGDPETSLSGVNTAVLTESAAKRFFGTEDPIGKSIRYEGINDYEIKGVVEDVPANSHFHFDILVSYKTLIRRRGEWIESTWISCPYYTYLYLRPGTDIEAFETKLKEFFKQKEKEIPKDKREDLDYHLQPIRDIHLFSNLDFEIENNGDGRAVYFLTVIALFILVIAWTNYINLSIAKSLERAKEIGIRKVVGAFRIQLIKQFLSESLLFNIVSAVLAIFIVQISSPYFNQLVNIPLAFTLWNNIKSWLILILMFSAGALLSGLYPAFVLSSFKPSAVLKGKSIRSGRGRVLRKCLVVFQFSISFALITGTLTVYKQISFMKSQDLGVNIDQTLVVRGPQYSRSYYGFLNTLETFKTEVKRIPAVSQAAVSTFVPGEDAWVRHGGRRRNVPKGDEKEFRIIGVDSDFVDFYQLEILAGRNFHKNLIADQNSLIINEEALKLLDFKSPDDAAGEEILYRDKPNRIVGVIKNYHQESLKENYKPLFLGRSFWGSNFSLKVDTRNLPKTISSIQDTWNKVLPGYPFDYFFLDDHFDSQYRADVQFGKTSGLFAFLAIFIGCLGLFGLSSYETILRTKEIGIRKILGASVLGTLTLLLKDITKLIFLAIAITLPISYFYFHSWLGNYAFRIGIGLWFFLIPTMLILIIALSAVGY